MTPLTREKLMDAGANAVLTDQLAEYTMDLIDSLVEVDVALECRHPRELMSSPGNFVECENCDACDARAKTRERLAEWLK